MEVRAVEILLLVSAAAVIILLLFLLLKRGGRKGTRAQQPRWFSPAGNAGSGGGAANPLNEERVRPCPICGHMLKRGETVHTKVFPGKSDQIAHIYGCPYCYPVDPENPRICPVCKKTVPSVGYVVARMFVQGNRRHVHVLGCTGCRRG